MGTIHFYDLKIKSYLIKRKKLKDYLFLIFNQEKKLIENVDIIFCSDSYLLKLNRKFLNHDYYTDTLTFPIYKILQKISGEIYISVDRVKENSKSFSTSYQNELARVIIHGCLHLCGYKEKKREEKKKMAEREKFYLLQFK